MMDCAYSDPIQNRRLCLIEQITSKEKPLVIQVLGEDCFMMFAGTHCCTKKLGINPERYPTGRQSVPVQTQKKGTDLCNSFYQ